MISPKPACVDETGGDMLHHIAPKLSNYPQQNLASADAGMALEEE